MPVDDRLTQCRLMPENQLAILFTLLLSELERSRTAILSSLKALGIRASETRQIDSATLSKLLGTLCDAGWLTVSHDGQYQLAKQERNVVLLSVWRSGALLRWQEPMRTFLARLSNSWSKVGPNGYGLEMVLALLQGNTEQLLHWIPLWEAYRQSLGGKAETLIQQLLADAAGLAILDQLDSPMRATLLYPHLRTQAWDMRALDGAHHYAISQLNTAPQLREPLSTLAIWRGDIADLPKIAQQGLALAPAMLLRLLQGQSPSALTLMDTTLAQRPGKTRKRKLTLPPELGLLYALALLARGEIAGNSVLTELIRHGIQQQYGHAYTLLMSLQWQSQGNPGLPASPAPQPAGFDGLVSVLLRYWLDDKETRQPEWEKELRNFAQQLRADGYELAAQEVDALLEAQFSKPRADPDWHSQRQLVPLVQLYQKQEAWQHALNALSRLSNPPDVAASPSTELRLVWLISLSHGRVMLEPREQKLSAKGQWSKGRAVALRRLYGDIESFDYLLEQDRRAIACISYSPGYYDSSSQYELDGHAALPTLAGHPALYWADAPDVRVDMATGQVALQLQESAGHIRLRLTPSKVTAESTLIWEKETPTRLLVYQVSAEVCQIAAIVGQELKIPSHGKQQLINAISGIAPWLPIHSDLPELAAHIDSIPADPKLYAHLLPLEEGLRLQLLVRPLDGGGWYAPGSGMENLLGEQNGKPIQAMRDLKTEKAALNTVLAACPGLQEAVTDGREWLVSEPQAALEVLSQLHDLDENLLECIWPEGERLRIKGRRDLHGMKLGLRTHANWFELSGELTLDDGEVLQLRQLLNLMQHSRGRFIKLDSGDWLALSNRLRQRLGQLALLANNGAGDGVRFNALTAPILMELQAEAGEFEADQGWREQAQRLESLRDWQPLPPATLRAELRDYQQEGYRWLSRLARWGVGACLADDMGLGKTVQALALLLERAPGGPQLVVAPTSVAMNWLAETTRFAPTLKLHPYQQTRDLSALGPFDLVVVSYGLLQQDSTSFSEQHWHSVVLDEAQAIKNAQTKRAQAAMALNADFRLAASGTPLENHLGELWNLFRFLNPGLLGSQERFNQRFTTPIEEGDALARQALKALIQPFILRRSKSQVLDELPLKTEITHKVTLSRDERHLYEALRQQAVDNLDTLSVNERKPLQVLTEITRLRRFCCHPVLVHKDSTLPGSKLAACAEIIADLLKNHHQALVFSQFVDHLAIVRQYLDQQGIRYQYLDGATRARERQARVDAFQAGDGNLFLISLKAGGTGLNLTAADYVIHLDPWWNPAVEDQASDRAHRIGQQRPVTVYRLVCEHTIEEQIVALHAKKRDLADSLLEGGEVSAKLDADALLALLRIGAG